MLWCKLRSLFLADRYHHPVALSVLALSLLVDTALFAACTAQAQSDSADAQTRVVGGAPVPANIFPSMVAVLMVSDEGTPVGLCGGTVIDPRWVLTAAHCVVHGGNTSNASIFRVVESTLNWQAGGRRLPVDRVVPEADYNPATHANDIALLELAQPSRVQPQMLASRVLRKSLSVPGTNATVTGWGDTATHRSAPIRAGFNRDISAELLQATMPIVSLERCRKAYPTSSRGEQIHDHNICAGLEEGGVDSCQGDSGGPLFTQHPTMGSVQIGVVSWGNGCAQAGQFGVYTSVGDFEPFIRQYVPNVSLAKVPDSSGDSLGDAQPPNMPPPGETAQVNVDVVPTGPIHLGTPVIVRVSSSDAGVLMLFAKDANGHVTQLFPNRYTATNNSALVANREIRAGATITVPGPADRFRLTAQAPVGDTVVMAIVAPPGAKVADLIDRHQGLEEIENWDAFVAQLADRLRAASLAEAAQKNGASGSRGLGVEEARPAIAMAERRFTVLQ